MSSQDFIRNQNDYDSQIINLESITAISNKISAEIGRKLARPEAAELINFVREQSKYNWLDVPIPEIRHTLAKLWLQKKFTISGRVNKEQKADIIDIHEIMKGHLGTLTQEPDYEKMNNVDVDGYPTDLKTETIENNLLSGQTDISVSLDASLPVMTPYPVGMGPSVPTQSTLGSLDNVTTIQTLLTCNTIGNISGFLGRRDPAAIQQLFNPQAAYLKNYITADTRHRQAAFDGIKKFQWTFLQGSTANREGVINSLGDVKQIVKIMCPNIRIPYSIANDNVFTNQNKRVTMLIEELSSQANIAQEGCRYHFIFSAVLDGNMIDLKALPNEHAYFEFAKPVTQLDTLTISFGNPFEPISFDIDRMNMFVTYSTGPGVPVRLTSTDPHNLQTGDPIYFSTFTTNSPALDGSLIATVNRTGGFNAQVIDDYNIDVYYSNFNPLDTTGIVGPISPYSTPIYFGSKRIIVPLEITYVGGSGQQVTS